jgi:hypothetical protein
LALGFAGSGSAWNAWIVGALILALADTSSLAFDFLSWLHVHELRYQVCTITPERLIRSPAPDQPIGPEQLCWQIVECSYQIRRTLLGQTSGVEVGMCLLGYRACVNGSITLDRLIDKELPEAGPVRRLRLKMAQRQVAHSLARTREVIPPGVPHAWHRSRP